MRVRFERWTGKRRAVVSVTVSVGATAALAAVAASVALGAPRPPVLRAGNPGGIVFARGGSHGPPSGHGNNPDLQYNGGIVLTSATTVTPVFWGKSWSKGDTKSSGMDSFYDGVGGTAYLGTTTEYTQTDGGTVNPDVSRDAQHGDLSYDSSTGHKAPSTTDVLAAVEAALTAANRDPVAYGYYPVYSDQPRGHNSYCAWHTWGTIGTTPVEFAFFFNLDNDPGCDPDGQSVSDDVVALGNVSGHELSETLTDPQLNAWQDSSGAENADKCAWKFGANPLPFNNHTSWKIQGNWSNSSYDTGTPTSYLGSGSGCIDGANTTQ